MRGETAPRKSLPIPRVVSSTLFLQAVCVRVGIYMCLRTGIVDFFVAAQSGALPFISCDVKTTISSNTLPSSSERREQARKCRVEQYPWQSSPCSFLGSFFVSTSQTELSAPALAEERVLQGSTGPLHSLNEEANYFARVSRRHNASEKAIMTAMSVVIIHFCLQ